MPLALVLDKARSNAQSKRASIPNLVEIAYFLTNWQLVDLKK
jgi:hypothetical protein